MLKRFSKYKKWSDYLNLNNSEVKIALTITAILVLFYFLFDVYGHFYDIQDSLGNFISCLMGGSFGLLGFALSGIAIVTTLFSKDVHDLINLVNGAGKMEKLMCSFEFLAFNVAVGIVLDSLLYFALSYSQAVINEVFFFIVYIFFCYFSLFNIFYTVSLVGNCLKLYELKNNYEGIAQGINNLKVEANEVRIDYIMLTLVKNKLIDPDTFMEELEREILDRCSSKNKKDIKDYFSKRYGV